MTEKSCRVGVGHPSDGRTSTRSIGVLRPGKKTAPHDPIRARTGQHEHGSSRVGARGCGVLNFILTGARPRVRWFRAHIGGEATWASG
jgi:hypothetical protein